MQTLLWLQATPFSQWVRESPSIWAYPTVLTAHTIGLGLLVGASVVLDLALLDCFPGTPIAPLERLYPIMWLGFWINAASGVSLFVADPVTKATQTIFYVKLLCVALGILCMIRIRRTTFVASPNTRRSRALAAASLGCWAAAITAGRLMAYVK